MEYRGLWWTVEAMGLGRDIQAQQGTDGIWRVNERTGEVRRADDAAEALYVCLRGVGAC